MHEQVTGIRTVWWVALLALLVVPQTAHAYLDPASGSMILQAVIGGVAAAALGVRYYWHRITAFLGFGRDDETESE